MPHTDDYDTMSDLCIEAAQAVMRSGSEELKAVMRVALAVLGQDIARRLAEPVTIQDEAIRIVRHAHS